MSGGTADAPTISVVIPTFNRAPFLGSMLASVFAQADCPPYEVILVDDASTDDTAAAVAATGHPVTLLRLEQNGGVARARQAGADRARGRLLAFHDSDDLMLPDRLGGLARHLAAHPEVGAVFSNGVVESATGEPAGLVVETSQAQRLDGRCLTIRDVLRDGLPMFLQTALVRREAFDRAGGIDTTLRRHADLELSCRLVLTTRVDFLDRPAFRYRLHGANQTRNRLLLREGLAEVMRRLRTSHPECVELCGADWYRQREVKHLRTIALKHLRRAHVWRAGTALAQALALTWSGGAPRARAAMPSET
jgi:glycosyltransferase involved in cell wall biosynthesis